MLLKLACTCVQQGRPSRERQRSTKYLALPYRLSYAERYQQSTDVSCRADADLKAASFLRIGDRLTFASFHSPSQPASSLTPSDTAVLFLAMCGSRHAVPGLCPGVDVQI